jgi:glucose-fructose oxidoreductase
VPALPAARLEVCLAREDVDAAYVSLSGQGHAAVCEACAREGVHVLCDSPMALSEHDCRRMMRACDEHHLKLMVAYALHFSPERRRALELIHQGAIGAPRLFSATFTDGARASGELGPLLGLGLSCVNAARRMLAAEPTEAFAFAVAPHGDPRFVEIDASLAAALRFAEPYVATFELSFDAKSVGFFRVVGEEGELLLENAFGGPGERLLRLRAGGKERKERFGEEDLAGAALDCFTDSVLSDAPIEADGWEGLGDVRVLAALKQSILSGQAVHLPSLERHRRPATPEQALLEDSGPLHVGPQH